MANRFITNIALCVILWGLIAAGLCWTKKPQSTENEADMQIQGQCRNLVSCSFKEKGLDSGT